MGGGSLVFSVFGHKPKCWTNYTSDLMMPLSEKSGDHQRHSVHPLGAIDVCTEYHDSLLKS